MTVDLHGELGGILLMSVGRTPAYTTNENGGLSITQAAMIERARVVSGGATSNLHQQEEVVAGTRSLHSLSYEKQGVLVAGAENPLSLLFNAYDITNVRRIKAPSPKP